MENITISKEQHDKFNEALKIAIYVLNTYKGHREEYQEASKSLGELKNLLRSE